MLDSLPHGSGSVTILGHKGREMSRFSAATVRKRQYSMMQGSGDVGMHVIQLPDHPSACLGHKLVPRPVNRATPRSFPDIHGPKYQN